MQGLIGSILALCWVGTACHPGGVTVSGTVEVPVEVQRLFSATQPGRLVVHAEPNTGLGWFASGTARFLCDPESGPLIVPFEVEDPYSCARPAAFIADVERVPDLVLSTVRCGEGRTGAPLFTREKVVASGRTTIFEDKHGNCPSGSTTVALTLTLLQPQ